MIRASAGPTVFVVIVSYRTAGRVTDLLHTLGPHVDSFVIVDNSNDASEALLLREAVDGRSRMKLVVSDLNRGFAAGVNAGLNEVYADAAPDDVVILLNPDVTLPDDSVHRVWRRVPVGEFITPALRTIDGRVWFEGASWRPLQRMRHNNFLGAPSLHGRQQTAFAPLTALGGRVSSWKAAGSLSEEYFLYYEDIEWCHRVILEGMRLFVDGSSFAIHEAGASSGGGESLTYHYFSARNGTYYYLAGGRGRLAGLIRGIVVTLSRVLRGEPARRRAVARANLRGLRDGLRHDLSFRMPYDERPQP